MPRTKKAAKKKAEPKKRKYTKQKPEPTNGAAPSDFLKSFKPIFRAGMKGSKLMGGMRLYRSPRNSQGATPLHTLTFGPDISARHYEYFTLGRSSDGDMLIVFDEPYFKAQSATIPSSSKTKTTFSVTNAVYVAELIDHFNLKPNKEKQTIAFFDLAHVDELPGAKIYRVKLLKDTSE